MAINKFIKPIVATLILPIACSASAVSLAEGGDTDYNYVGVNAGVVSPSNIQGNSSLQSVTGNTTYTAGISVGRKFMDRFGAELEYMYRGKSDIDSATTVNLNNASNSWSVSANTFMFNVTADLLTGYAVRPYVKLGAGASSNKASQYVVTGNTSGTTTWNGKTTTEFAWQAGFGVNIATNKMIDTNIEYAFVDRGEFKTATGSTQVTTNGVTIVSSDAAQTGKLRDQIVTIGFKVKF